MHVEGNDLNNKDKDINPNNSKNKNNVSNHSSDENFTLEQTGKRHSSYGSRVKGVVYRFMEQ